MAAGAAAIGAVVAAAVAAAVTAVRAVPEACLHCSDVSKQHVNMQ